MLKKSLKNNDKNSSKKGELKKENTSWGNVANWYDSSIEREGSYQRDLILPNLLRLMNIKSGEKVIDVACGQGFFSREIAKIGANVVGTDISPELIEIARERSRGMKIDYFISSADKISKSDAEFDKAVIVLALQDMENLSGAISEVSRILRPGGEFFIVINHPAFRIPKRSSWGFDEKTGRQFRQIDEYMSESRIKMEVHPGMDKNKLTTSFHRPLQTYFKAFQKAGMVVSRLEEWVSEKQSEPGPRADAENKSRREFPMFMALVLKKE